MYRLQVSYRLSKSPLSSRFHRIFPMHVQQNQSFQILLSSRIRHQNPQTLLNNLSLKLHRMFPMHVRPNHPSRFCQVQGSHIKIHNTSQESTLRRYRRKFASYQSGVTAELSCLGVSNINHLSVMVGAVQCSAVQCSASAVQCSAVQCSAVK